MAQCTNDPKISLIFPLWFWVKCDLNINVGYIFTYLYRITDALKCTYSKRVSLIYPSGKIRKDSLSKLPFKCVNTGTICCVRKRNLSFVIVQFNCDYLWFPFQSQLSAGRGLSPIGFLIICNYPETLFWTEVNCSLSLLGKQQKYSWLYCPIRSNHVPITYTSCKPWIYVTPY